MATENLIPASDFCVYHHIEFAFFNALQEAGLVEITIQNNNMYIPEAELQKLERMIRLHNELEINVPGIEAITHLLERFEALQEHSTGLKNKLRRYEND